MKLTYRLALRIIKRGTSPTARVFLVWHLLSCLTSTASARTQVYFSDLIVGKFNFYLESSGMTPVLYEVET